MFVICSGTSQTLVPEGYGSCLLFVPEHLKALVPEGYDSCLLFVPEHLKALVPV
jgi:hypothetical protein